MNMVQPLRKLLPVALPRALAVGPAGPVDDLGLGGGPARRGQSLTGHRTGIVRHPGPVGRRRRGGEHAGGVGGARRVGGPERMLRAATSPGATESTILARAAR